MKILVLNDYLSKFNTKKLHLKPDKNHNVQQIKI